MTDGTSQPRGEVPPLTLAAPGGDWFPEPEPHEGGSRWAAVLLRRWYLIMITAVVAAVTALVVLPSLQKVYQAKATLFVNPVPTNDENLVGLGLLTTSSDPSRDIETASQFVTTPDVAERVRRLTGTGTSVHKLLTDVDAVPVAQSDIVAVTAKASSPALAARLANAFVRSTIADRTARLHARLDRVLPRLQGQIAVLDARKPAAQSLEAKLQELRTLRGENDPTLSEGSLASPPLAPVSPRRTLSVIAAALGGAIIGAALLLAAEFFEPRLQREDDLRQYRLPVLARVPLVRGRLGRRVTRPVLPDSAAFAVGDAYQLLAAAVAASPSDAGKSQSVAVTGPTPGAGKTTTALHLATSLGELHSRVVLIEVDSRQPALSTLLGVEPRVGVRDVISRSREFADALVTVEHFAPWVTFLLERRPPSSDDSVLSTDAVGELAREGGAIADWVVFDAPPPNYASDGLTIATQADVVIVVVRLGATRRRELAELAELFAQQRIRPLGFVVVGSSGRKPYVVPGRPSTPDRTLQTPGGQPSSAVTHDGHEGSAVTPSESERAGRRV